MVRRPFRFLFVAASALAVVVAWGLVLRLPEPLTPLSTGAVFPGSVREWDWPKGKGAELDRLEWALQAQGRFVGSADDTDGWADLYEVGPYGVEIGEHRGVRTVSIRRAWWPLW